jgi:uncharacterized protein (TIGR02996 family)
MEQEREFVDAIQAQPEGDAPRLRYAAWLQERGDPRGDFIDAQVRWHQARLTWDGAEMVRQAARERELLRQHKAAWLAPVEALGLFNVEFRRGFVEAVGIQAARFLKNSEKLFELAPLLHDLQFYQEKPELLPRLAEYPPFRRLDAVEFGDCAIPAAALGTFAASPYAANLRSLSLNGSRLSGPTIPVACVQLLGLPRLIHLKFNRIGVCLRGLRQRLPPTPLGDEVVMALAQCPDFSRLRTLDVSGTGITDAAVAALAGSPYLACSEGLYLDRNELTDGAVQALANSPRSACLTNLGIWLTRVGNAGLEGLIQSPHLGSLRSLRISTRITDPGVRMLAAAPASSRLRSLDLAFNRQLGVAGAEALAASEHLTKLQTLNLRDTRIGPGGALALLDSTRLPALRWLVVGTEGGGWDRAVGEAMEKRFGYLC